MALAKIIIVELQGFPVSWCARPIIAEADLEAEAKISPRTDISTP